MYSRIFKMAASMLALSLCFCCFAATSPIHTEINHYSKENIAMTERTLSIIKPDCVGKNVIGKILSRFEDNGLRIVAGKMVQLSEDQAKEFYKIHAERPFYGELVEFMTSGPVFVSVLEGENAVVKNREIMGATNPKEAAEGTIRRDFADSIDANAVHGSDSLENAKIEIDFFFPAKEICARESSASQAR